MATQQRGNKHEQSDDETGGNVGNNTEPGSQTVICDG